MDKQTLSNYGWLVIVTLILAVMLALATPFGTYVGDGVVSVANGFVGASNEAINEDNVAINEDKWEEKMKWVAIGDINEDGSIDNLDRMVLNRLLAKWDGYDYAISTISDIDQNGVINDTDVTILNQYLANWDGEYLIGKKVLFSRDIKVEYTN